MYFGFVYISIAQVLRDCVQDLYIVQDDPNQTKEEIFLVELSSALQIYVAQKIWERHVMFLQHFTHPERKPRGKEPRRKEWEAGSINKSNSGVCDEGKTETFLKTAQIKVWEGFQPVSCAVATLYSFLLTFIYYLKK